MNGLFNHWAGTDFYILLPVSFTPSSILCSFLSLPMLTLQFAATNPSRRYVSLQLPSHTSLLPFLVSSSPPTLLLQTHHYLQSPESAHAVLFFLIFKFLTLF